MNELPFELKKKHKSKTKYGWKRYGLIMDNFEEIYKDYIHATHCDLCGKEFTKSIDRQMEHDHQTGEFRNIVCSSCNSLKKDRKQSANNTSGYVGIHKRKDKKMKQGFTWRFIAVVNNKNKTIKSCKDFDKLVKFADKWKKDNNYHT